MRLWAQQNRIAMNKFTMIYNLWPVDSAVLKALHIHLRHFLKVRYRSLSQHKSCQDISSFPILYLCIKISCLVSFSPMWSHQSAIFFCHFKIWKWVFNNDIPILKKRKTLGSWQHTTHLKILLSKHIPNKSLPNELLCNVFVCFVAFLKLQPNPEKWKSDARFRVVFQACFVTRCLVYSICSSKICNSCCRITKMISVFEQVSPPSVSG